VVGVTCKIFQANYQIKLVAYPLESLVLLVWWPDHRNGGSSHLTNSECH